MVVRALFLVAILGSCLPLYAEPTKVCWIEMTPNTELTWSEYYTVVPTANRFYRWRFDVESTPGLHIRHRTRVGNEVHVVVRFPTSDPRRNYEIVVVYSYAGRLNYGHVDRILAPPIDGSGDLDVIDPPSDWRPNIPEEGTRQRTP